MISIAVDGPSGAGKSTLSCRMAKQLGYVYVDTGAMYRAIGLAALRSGANTKNSLQLSALLPGIQLALQHTKSGQRIFLNGEDVSEDIRAEQVGMAASDISAHVPVRQFLLETQRRLAREHNVVMDGRDIGTVVLPNANIKIFLTATAQDRALRRYNQLKRKGENPSYETVLKDVETRDFNDTSRAAAPLRRAEDAVLVDTTGMDVQAGYKSLISAVREKLLQQGGAP